MCSSLGHVVDTGGVRLSEGLRDGPGSPDLRSFVASLFLRIVGPVAVVDGRRVDFESDVGLRGEGGGESANDGTFRDRGEAPA